MKERLNILDNLFGIEFDLNSGIFEKQEELQSLYQDRFKLNDLNITARVLNYWKGQGLLPDKSDADSLSPLETDTEKKIRVDNRFNFFELIYLYILQDLREIGLSLEKLKNVKDFLFQKLDVLDFLNHISDS